MSTTKTRVIAFKEKQPVSYKISNNSRTGFTLEVSGM
jgi:hypothetical protein